MAKEIEVGSYAYLKEPVKGYRRVEVIEFYGRKVLVRTESGWEFTVYISELEAEDDSRWAEK